MDHDRHRFECSKTNCETEESVDTCGEGNCGGGDGDGSDREETLDGVVKGDEKEGDGGLGMGGGERYDAKSDRFESRWAPWGLSGSERKSRLPERKEFSVWRSEDDDDVVEKDNEDMDLCELPMVHASPLAIVAPTDVVTADGETTFIVGVGLKNLGNTCFLNSVLQCLVRTSPFRQGLCMVNHRSPCDDEEFCLICCLRELVHHAFTSFCGIAPCCFANNLRYFSPDFMPYQQEDAHEFLQCLLDKLEIYPIFSSNPCSVNSHTNLAREVFGGSLVSKLRCSKCNHISCTPENLIDFSLEIDDAYSLEGALDSFTKPEKIEDIMLTCDGCKERVSMEKQFVIDQAPLIASFHLKRFKNDGTIVEKIVKHIEYPLSLDLHPYTANNPEHNAHLLYDLYAVIVHAGFSSNSGHYYCYVRSSPSTWHEFDDLMVTRVGENHVLSREAYILFYAKQGTSYFNYNDIQSFCHPVPPKYSPNSVLETANQSSESDSSTENLTMRENSDKEASEDSYRPAFIGPQLMNVEGKNINSRRGDNPKLVDNSEDNDKNDIDMEDPSFNFDMLLNDEDEENRNDTTNSSLNFDLIKGEVNNDGRKMTNKNGSPVSFEEKKKENVEQTCSDSPLTDDEFAASTSAHKVGNFRNKHIASSSEVPSKSPNSEVRSSSFPSSKEKHRMVSAGNTTNPGLSGSPEATKKALNHLRRKRSPEKPVDDPRLKQVCRTLKKTHMPSSRAKKLVAAMNGSPDKINRKSPSHVRKNFSPRKACRKNQNRVISPSVRSIQ